jgi:hypothetical protein
VVQTPAKNRKIVNIPARYHYNGKPSARAPELSSVAGQGAGDVRDMTGAGDGDTRIPVVEDGGIIAFDVPARFEEPGHGDGSMGAMGADACTG